MAWYECFGEDCGKCDWKTAAYWALGVAVLGGVIAVLVIAFAVVYPPKATVDDAVMTRLELQQGTPASNSTMSYNITVTLSLSNPNIYRGIKYDRVAAAFSYNGSRFDESATVPAFLQAARKPVTFHVTVGGDDKPLKLATAATVVQFKTENITSNFGVEMRLDTTIRYKGRKTQCPLAVICPLKLQLVDPNVAATAFQRTKCTVLKAKKSGC